MKSTIKRNTLDFIFFNNLQNFDDFYEGYEFICLNTCVSIYNIHLTD